MSLQRGMCPYCGHDLQREEKRRQKLVRQQLNDEYKDHLRRYRWRARVVGFFTGVIIGVGVGISALLLLGFVYVMDLYGPAEVFAPTVSIWDRVWYQLATLSTDFVWHKGVTAGLVVLPPLILGIYNSAKATPKLERMLRDKIDRDLPALMSYEQAA